MNLILNNNQRIILIVAAVLLIAFFFVPMYSFTSAVPSGAVEGFRTFFLNYTWPTATFLSPFTPFMLFFADGFGVHLILFAILPLLMLLPVFRKSNRNILVLCIIGVAIYIIFQPFVHGTYNFSNSPNPNFNYSGLQALQRSIFHWIILGVYALIGLLNAYILVIKAKNAPKV